jgi:hypothetical protein
LKQCLESIKHAGEAHVCLVAPKDFLYSPLMEAGLIDQFVMDPGIGLPNAINAGFSELPSEIEYINWLGDDDLLSPDSLLKTTAVLDSAPNADFHTIPMMRERDPPRESTTRCPLQLPQIRLAAPVRAHVRQTRSAPQTHKAR